MFPPTETIHPLGDGEYAVSADYPTWLTSGRENSGRWRRHYELDEEETDTIGVLLVSRMFYSAAIIWTMEAGLLEK